MRVIPIVLLALSAALAVIIEEDYDDLIKENIRILTEDNNDFEKSVSIRLQHSKQCTRPSTLWRCTPGCYESFTNITGKLPNKCVIRTPGETCFGQHLDYARLETEERFPVEYQVLQNYPKCWSYLAPLICSNHFRPCLLHRSVIVSGEEMPSTKIVDVEMWAKIRKGFCHKTLNVCQDVIDAGYFPNFINCDKETSLNITGGVALDNPSGHISSKIYSDSCTISSPPIQFNAPLKCPEPLVYIEGNIAEATPVLDKCYIKCRASHQSFINSQHIFQLLLGFGLTFVFVATWIYLQFFSISHRKSFVVFCMTHSIICISIWTFCWFIGPILLKIHDCVEVDGTWIRRTAQVKGFHQLCNIQSALLTFSMASAYSWLSAVAYFGLANPYWLRSNEKTLSGLPMRTVFFTSVYLLCAAFAIILQLFHLHETDGISGVCMTGLLSTHKYTGISAVPFLSTFIMLISTHIFKRTTRFCEKAALSTTLEYVKNRYKYEVERRKLYCKSQNIANPAASDLKNVDEVDLEEAEDNGDIENLEHMNPPQEHIDSKAVHSCLDAGSYVHRVLESYDKPKFRDALRKGLDDAISDTTWEHIIQDSLMQFVALYLKNFKRHRLNFISGIGYNWLIFMIGIAITVVWLALPLHYFFLNSNEHLEKEYIKDYIQCAVKQSLFMNDTEWIYTGKAEDAFHQCELKSHLSEHRASAVPIFFILLPTFPFLVLIAAVLTGLFGRGGMKRVSNVKWSNEGITFEEGLLPEKLSKNVYFTDEEDFDDDEDGEEQSQVSTSPHQSQEQPGPSKTSLATTHHHEENSEHLDTALPRPQSGGRVPGTDALSNLVGRSLPAYDDNQSESSMPKQTAAEQKDLEELAQQIKAFIENYGSPAQGMNPLPLVQDVARLTEDLKEAARRERILSSQHQLAMEAIRDLGAFVNYHAEKLRADEELWNTLLVMLQNLQAATNDLFPECELPDGIITREIPPQFAKIYEVLVPISEFLHNIDNHRGEIKQWRNVTYQAGNRIQNATREIISKDDPSNNAQQSSTSQPRNAQVAQHLDIPDQMRSAQSRNQSGKVVQLVPSGPNRRNSTPVYLMTPQTRSMCFLIQEQPSGQRGQMKTITLASHNSSTNNQQGQGYPSKPSNADQQGQRTAAQTAAPANQQSLAGLNQALMQQRRQVLLQQANEQAHAQVLAQNGVQLGPNQPQQIQRAQQAQAQIQTNNGQAQGALIPQPINPALLQNHGRHINQGSAYMETYSVAPAGFFTRFTNQELQIRITRMQEIHGNNPYPQELMFAFILTGDIRLAGNDSPDNGERLVMPSEYPSIFGRAATPINVVTPPREFLLAMRRRAILFVATLGFHLNVRGRTPAAFSNFSPPIFPDLGMTTANELLLLRIFGTQNLVRSKELLIQLLSRTFLEASPHIPEVGAFANYLDRFATERGFPHQREDWVHDPVQPPVSTYPPVRGVAMMEAKEEDEDEGEEELEEELNQPSTSGLQNQEAFMPTENKEEEASTSNEQN